MGVDKDARCFGHVFTFVKFGKTEQIKQQVFLFNGSVFSSLDVSEVFNDFFLVEILMLSLSDIDDVSVSGSFQRSCRLFMIFFSLDERFII